MDEVRLVSDANMLAAMEHLLGREQLVAEPAGAAATAALMRDARDADMRGARHRF